MLFIKKSDCRRSSSPTSVGSLTGLNSFKAVWVTRLAELQRRGWAKSSTSVGESFYETPSYISFSYRKWRAWKEWDFYKITKKSDCRRSLFPTSVGESFYETPSYISFSYRKRRAWKVTIPRIVTLTHAPLHLIGNQSVEFDCVFHWEFFGEWFDKAHDNHLCGFGFG